ncbi:MAG: cytochrome C [Rhodobacteraceae bacterium GWE1_64_9]|nr:MAG: cytochrome C [Rhodobacteraceae bacterium GWE1_64_9]OHC48942.1 MAG: cytochrome C [Rhodobacteraceae bacterium GWF1_65_7]
MTLTPLFAAVLGTSLAAMALLPTAALAEDSQTFERIKVEAGAALFDASCRRCHATDASHESYGPKLEGVIGRAAGSVEGYPYSKALKSAGFVWTEPALKAWMADNTGFVPGTKMRHVGITDPVVEEFILAYLRVVPAAN